MQRIVEDRINETYKTSIGAQLDYFSSISLLNRYVQTLPTDYFTKPTILWRKKPNIQEPNKLTVLLEMPPQSPLRQEIEVSYYQSLFYESFLLKVIDVNDHCNICREF